MAVIGPNDQGKIGLSTETAVTPKSRCLCGTQQLGEGAALWVAPEFADPVGPLGEHQDVEKLGPSSGAQGIETLTQPALQLVRSH
jgi:hypothetical protein